MWLAGNEGPDQKPAVGVKGWVGRLSQESRRLDTRAWQMMRPQHREKGRGILRSDLWRQTQTG